MTPIAKNIIYLGSTIWSIVVEIIIACNQTLQQNKTCGLSFVSK
jgi:hypothetical protein